MIIGGDEGNKGKSRCERHEGGTERETRTIAVINVKGE